MARKNGMKRREFIAASAAALGAAAVPSQAAETSSAPQMFRSPGGSLIPYSRAELFPAATKQRTFTGAHLAEIAFPLGGIGTGTVSLGGRGEFRDWEIFNRPGKGRALPMAFTALWMRPVGGKARVNILESAPLPPFTGWGGAVAGSGGYRPGERSVAGLPHFKSARFTGVYPIAHIEFEDDSLPVSVSLEAFNPFIPLNVDDSSLPVAIFHYHVKSHSPTPIDLALAFSVPNVVGYDGKVDLIRQKYPGFGKNLTKYRQEQIASGISVAGLDMTSQKYAADHPFYGSMALLTTHPDGTARPMWKGELTSWMKDFSANGMFENSPEPQPSADGNTAFASMAPRWRLAPGESKTITFILAWYFPTIENYWDAVPGYKGARLRNDYGTRFQSAWEVGIHTASRLKELEDKTRSFQTAFFSSTLPPYVLDAVSSQADIIRTNTCLLLEGKKLFGFEGCNDDRGCCPMNCTHVWNYEQTLAFLFPELERSMRVTDFQNNIRPDGSMVFRTLLPLNPDKLRESKSPADGQMGCILKMYREWQISGDHAFLQELWPNVKRALDFAWVDWDAKRDGVMDGEQYNTYDIPFYGPNSMITTLYLGALRSGELMATAMGDKQSADTYRQIRESGCQKIEKLWNGEFYIQQIPPLDKIHPWGNQDRAKWYADTVQDGELRYQYGDGCLSDQLLGQWWAEMFGLNLGLPSERIRKTLQSIYRYNFKHDFYDYPNLERIYALNDEKGLLVCSWPNDHRPLDPVLYSDEVWTGIEYQVAAHLIYEGFLEEGLSIVKGVRDRYDGQKRNPWNEVECGSHYARAMSSWSVLMALSGFQYSGVEQRITFAPRLNHEHFRTFFAAGSGWGVFSQSVAQTNFHVTLESHHGEVRFRHLHLKNELGATKVSVSSIKGPEGNSLQGHTVKADAHSIQIDFGRELVLPAGKELALTLG